MAKVLKTGKMPAVRGGKGKMIGKQHVGQQAPGITSTKSGKGGKFAAGGKTKMFGFSGSKPAYGC